MRRLTLLSFLLAFVLIVSACAAPAPSAQPAAGEEAAPAEAAPPQEEAAAESQADDTQAAPQPRTEAPAEATPEPEPNAEPLKIGLLSLQSGALAFYGIQQSTGFMLGLEYATDGTLEVAGRPIEVVMRDTEGNPDTGVARARELIEAEGVDLLVGSVSSAVAGAIEQVAQDNKIVYIIEPAAASSLTGANFNPYVFRTSRNSYQDALTVVPYMLENGLCTKWIQLAADYSFGRDSAEAVRYAVEQRGGAFAADDIFAPLTTTDFTPYIQQIADSDADCVFLTWAGTGYITLYQQLSELGLTDPDAGKTFVTGFGDNVSFAAVYGEAVGSVGLSLYHYTFPKNPVNDWLVKRHKEEYGAPPDLFTAGGMAAAIAVVQALEKTGGDASADALIPTLEGMSFAGPKGTYTIRKSDHVTLQPMYLARLLNVDDPEYKFFELIAEIDAKTTAPPCLLEGEYASRCSE